jgi:fucose 4-O-acetylase-like acetyltransferase
MRNHLFDNAKALLMLLVVFGHLIEPVIDNNPLIKSIYLTIYAFHMPAFVLISGMFSKNWFSDEHMKNNIKGILIPFIFFEIIYEMYSILTTHNVSSYLRDIQPNWILWYLWSLFIWKTAAPIINQFRYPLTLSTVVAILAGYCEDIGYFLGLSRTIIFFPFFLLGLNHKNYLQHFHCSHLMRLASVFIISATFFVFLKLPMARPGWFYGSYPFSVFNLTDWHAGLYRFCTYLLSTTLILAFLCLAPTQKTRLNQLGINTLAIYVWHGLLIKILREFDLIDNLLEINVYFYLATTLTTAIVICYLFSRDKVQQATATCLLNPIERLVFGNNLNKQNNVN